MFKKKIKKLLIGTNNRGKFKEIRDLLPKHIKIVSTSAFKLKSPQENGKTFEQNSLIKSRYFSQRTKLICLADDSGLEIDILNKRPGIYSARWAGKNSDFGIAIKKVFRERKADGFEYHRDFLSSSINLMKDDDQEIIESAKATLKLFPNNETIRALVAFLLYGETNVNQAYVVYQEGFKEAENNDFNSAANKFIEAFELFPMDYLFAENAGMSLVKNKNFKEAIEYFKKAIELENTEEKTGKSEFGLATCYFELNEKELACDFFTKSMILKYKPAFSSYNKLCGK